jgi:hypothetical protein
MQYEEEDGDEVKFRVSSAEEPGWRSLASILCASVAEMVRCDLTSTCDNAKIAKFRITTIYNIQYLGTVLLLEISTHPPRLYFIIIIKYLAYNSILGLPSSCNLVPAPQIYTWAALYSEKPVLTLPGLSLTTRNQYLPYLGSLLLLETSAYLLGA